MIGSSMLVLLFLSYLCFVFAWDINNNGDRRDCQDLTEPLEGCDKERTIFVDPVNPAAQFKTVQSGGFDGTCLL